jgi:segregation and condensation protein A
MMRIDIKLDAFEGPLDLLLHLITREEVDIYDIPIVSITAQYFEAIKDVDTLDLDFASEFIVMAATLLEIKSKMLLPDQNEMEVYEFAHEDPRLELVKRLVAYKLFKEMAMQLRNTEGTLDEVIFREQDDLNQYIQNVPKSELNKDLEASLLVEAVKRLMIKMNRFDENRQTYFKGIKRDHFTVEDKFKQIRFELKRLGNFNFSMLFGESITKEEVVVTFLALLELLKLKEIRIKQSELFGEIEISKRETQIDEVEEGVMA